LAEYAYNSAVSESAKVSPFEANYGFAPRTNWLNSKTTTYCNPESELLVTEWAAVWQDLKETLSRAQERQRKWHDKKRLPAPEFATEEDVQKGLAEKADKVMLNRKNIRTKRPMEKLDHKMFGPFTIKRKVGNRAYELDLPKRMRIHPVFNVGLLEPYREPQDPSRKAEPPLPDIVDEESSYVVKAIVDSRWYGSKNAKFPQRFVQYMVSWEGYGPEENSWEPYEVLKGTAEHALVE